MKFKTKATRDIKKGDKGNDVYDVQSAACLILDQHGFPWRKTMRDGDGGPATITAVHFAGWLLGFSRKRLNRIAQGTITREDQKYLRREWKRPDGMVKRDKRRRPRVVELKKRHKESQLPDPDGDGLADFEGTTVDAEFVPWLKKARAKGWTGWLTSGFRTPEYSESLCFRMCGQPSCPGRCAGKSSRHSQKWGNGAIDATDYVRLGQIFKEIGAPFFNSLGAADPVHFSKFGN